MCISGLAGHVGLHLGAGCELSLMKHAQRPEWLQVCRQQHVGLDYVWRQGVERGVKASRKNKSSLVTSDNHTSGKMWI